MMILSPETEVRLQTVASQRGLSPEETLDQVLAEAQADYEDARARTQTPSRPAEAGLSPTMALFHRWAAEDATDDPEEIARRTQETDELMAALRASPLSLRVPDLSDEENETGEKDEAA